MSTFTVFGQTFTFTDEVGQSFRVKHPAFTDGRKDFRRGHTETPDGIKCWDNAATMVAKVERALAKVEVRV